MKSSCISFMSPCSRYSNKKIKPQPTKCTAFTNTKVHFLRRTSTCTWLLWGTEGGRKCQEWRLRRVTNHLKNQGAPPCKTLNSLGRASHCASPTFARSTINHMRSGPQWIHAQLETQQPTSPVPCLNKFLGSLVIIPIQDSSRCTVLYKDIQL